jgi:beta-galactosidase
VIGFKNSPHLEFNMSGELEYHLDLTTIKNPSLRNDCIHLGTADNNNGESFDLNSKYLIKNKQPWLPVMGEFHFSRYPKNGWENAILKMKAGGIEIIASYIFWIHHEEEKEKWNWQDNRDLRYFASLCSKHHVYLFMRIGPWSHGEARNGGHPDWILKYRHLRQNNPIYMGFVRELYRQIHEQLRGMYLKEGGPVIGIQLENERNFNNSPGLEYMLALKKMVREIGIDVPYYTATGWQGYDGTQQELIPVWGAYPDWPWARELNELVNAKRGFSFSPYLHESDIGNDLLAKGPKMGKIADFPYPVLTAEMGAGTQCTHHRRPIFNIYDGASLIVVKIGSGANGIGYYVFHGGSNSIGSLTTLQESKASHYPNDLPIISYDFYAPIGEWGQIRSSYKKLKQIHFFLHDFGHFIAECPVVFPEKQPMGINDNQTLRWTVRTNGQYGFVFINNYQRHMGMEDIKNVQFHLKLNEGHEITFPEKPITIPSNTIAILPFNLRIENILFVYTTTQPFCVLNHEYNSSKTLVMIALDGIAAEMALLANNLHNVSGTKVDITQQGTLIRFRIPEPNYDVSIKLEMNDGSTVNIVVLSPDQGLNAWKIHQKGKDLLLISDATIMSNDESVRIEQTGKITTDLYVYPSAVCCQFKQGPTNSKDIEGVFAKFKLAFTEKKIDLHWKEDLDLPSRLKKSKAPVHSSRFSPIRCYPLYDTVLASVKGARYWKVTLPSDIFEGVSDIFLKIEYEGDTQAIYINGHLVADNFFAGEPMIIGLKRFESELKQKELVLLVTPLEDFEKVYLEKNVKQQFTTKSLPAIMKSIIAVPQYTAEFQIKE